MKKQIVKKRKSKAKKAGYLSSWKNSHGSLGIGMGFALLGILAIIGMSVLMVGNITPLSNTGSSQQVIILSNTPEPSKSNLQLYTFPAITLTPTPIPTNPPQPQERGGFNYGSAPGPGPGNSAPQPGSGGGSGGGGGTAI